MNNSSYVGPEGVRPHAAAARCGDACGVVCDVQVIHADAVRTARAALPSEAEQAELTRLFTAFANTTRLNLLVALRSAVGADRPELCVCDLVAITGASQSMVSHQLGLLREAKLATRRRAGRLVYYRLAAGPLAALLDGALRAVRHGTALLTALVVLAGFVGACSRREAPAPPARPAAPAAATAQTFHGGPAAHPNDWCGSHGVPESECTRCNPELIAQFQARHDWCGEHGVPESQCAACHPELLRQGVAPPRPRGAPTEPGEHGDRTPRGDGSAGLAPGTTVRLASATVAARVGVETVTATDQPLAEEVSVPARLAFDPTRLARVSARVPGVVRAVAVGVGAIVRPGDLLLTLDSAAAAATRAEVEAGRTRARNAELTLQRARALQAEGVGSRADVERAESELAAARASLAGFAAAGTAVNGAGRAVRVLSPRAGVVVARAASVGQQVTAEEVLVEVADLSRMWAILDVPDAQAPRLVVGQAVAIELDGFAAPLAGTIAYLAPMVDSHTRTVEARVELPNPDGRLRANAFGRARIAIAAPTQGVVLPRDALQRVEAQDVVFVERSTAVYEARVVTVARRTADQVLLRQGVAPGDRVVTTGGFELKTELLRESIGAGCCDDG